VTELRSSLPPMPAQMRRLPVDRGFPVPWFVPWFDEEGNQTPAGTGKPDFRVGTQDAMDTAILGRLCWICGLPLAVNLSFVIGPMCAVNRVSSEPPSHFECADFAARACPFLSNPSAHRRERNMPEESIKPAGFMIERNPGVTLVWTTREYRLIRVDTGVLFDVGRPAFLRWYRESRRATRAEIMESIDSGVPILLAQAEKDGPEAVLQLKDMVKVALRLVPAA
jgi:hypothetical protein